MGKIFLSDLSGDEEMKDNIRNEEKQCQKRERSLTSFQPMAGLDIHNSFSRVKSVNQTSSSFSSSSSYLAELAMLLKPPR